MRGLAAAGAIWSASILLSRLVGLVREAALGRTLGLSGEADVYQAAFTVPDFLNYLLAGGAMAVVFVPLQAAHLARADERGAWRALLAVGRALALALVALGLVAWLAMPALVALAAPGFDASQRAELAHLSRILLSAQAFHILGGLLSAALLARGRHVLSALAPVVYSLAVVAGGLAAGTAEGFAWGVLAGSFAGPFLLPLLGCLRLGLRWEAPLPTRHADLSAWFLRSLPIMAGFSIVVADDWFLRAHGSVIGTGAAATLGYAKALLRVPVGVFGMAAGLAAYPALARMAAEGRHDELRAQLSRALRTVVLLALAAQAALTVAGGDIAALVYGRSRLSPAELEGVADALALCSVGLVAWSAQPLLARGFYALGNTWLPAVLGTVVALLAWPMYGLARERLGVSGLALTSALAIGLHAVALHAALARRLGRGTDARPALAFAARALASFGVSLGAGLALARALPPAHTTSAALLRVCLLAGAAVGAFGAAAVALRLTEARSALDPLLRRLRGAPRAQSDAARGNAR